MVIESSQSCSNSVKVEDVNVKKETEEPRSSPHHQSCVQNPPLSYIHKSNLKCPTKYVIRKPVDGSSTIGLRRILPRRKRVGEFKKEDKEPSSDVLSSVVPTGVANNIENPVKFWRTPAGKIVKLDGSTSTEPFFASRTLDQNTTTKSKLIRLADGTLVRVSAKKTDLPLSYRNRYVHVPAPNGMLSKLSGSTEPEETTSTTSPDPSSSEPIDVATLIGTDKSYEDKTPLFDSTEGCTSVKAEPADVDSAPERPLDPLPTTLMDESPIEPYPKKQTPINRASFEESLLARYSKCSKSSLTTAPKSISFNSQVGDLRKIVDEPLYTRNAAGTSLRYIETESCNVCRQVLPGMKKNLLCLEARLNGLVDTVQKLIVHLNPLDRKAFEIANEAHARGKDQEKASTSFLTALSKRNFPPENAPPGSSCVGDKGQNSDRVLSVLLPVARVGEGGLEMRTVSAEEVARGIDSRTNVVRFLRQPTKSTATVSESPLTSTRPANRRIRFVVANQATAQRTVVSCSSTATHAERDKSESSSRQGEQVKVPLSADVKPSSESMFE